MELLNAAVAWFIANWGAIEGLARNFAADLATLWALGLALAQVLRPFFPGAADKLQSKLLGK